MVEGPQSGACLGSIALFTPLRMLLCTAYFTIFNTVSSLSLICPAFALVYSFIGHCTAVGAGELLRLLALACIGYCRAIWIGPSPMIPYYTMQYHTIPCNTILYYTIRHKIQVFIKIFYQNAKT